MDKKKVVAKGQQVVVSGGIAGTLAVLLVTYLLPNLAAPGSSIAITGITVALTALIRMAHNYIKHMDDDPIDRVPNRSRAVALFLPVLFLLFMPSCATIQEIENPKQIALGSLIAAEGAYSVAYLEYRAGRLSSEDMAIADQVYNLWRIAHTAFVQSIPLIEGETFEDLEYLMPRTISELRAELEGTGEEEGVLRTTPAGGES